MGGRFNYKIGNDKIVLECRDNLQYGVGFTSREIFELRQLLQDALFEWNSRTGKLIEHDKHEEENHGTG